MSKASYSGFCSALMDIYRSSGYDMGEDFKKDLSTFMCGIKREVVRERVEKGMVLDEGKNRCHLKCINVCVRVFMRVKILKIYFVICFWCWNGT